MNPCQFKKGIFVQRACQQGAAQSCGKCAINVCEKHSGMNAGQRLCHNCLLDADAGGVDKKSGFSRSEHARSRYMQQESYYYLWYATSRRDYYDTYGNSKPFDERDYDSFDAVAPEAGDGEFDEDDFFDS